MSFKVLIEPEAIQDIQQGIDWYNQQQGGLGRGFHTEIKIAFEKLKSNPFYQVRYDDVRCLPLKKFPYMLHFTVNAPKKLVVVRAIFSTSRNPKIWKNR